MKPQTELVKKYVAAFTAMAGRLEAENVQISAETTRNRYGSSARFSIYSTESNMTHEASFEVKSLEGFHKLESRVHNFPIKDHANEAEFIEKINKVIRTLFGSSAPRLEVQP